MKISLKRFLFAPYQILKVRQEVLSPDLIKLILHIILYFRVNHTCFFLTGQCPSLSYINLERYLLVALVTHINNLMACFDDLMRRMDNFSGRFDNFDDLATGIDNFSDTLWTERAYKTL